MLASIGFAIVAAVVLGVLATAFQADIEFTLNIGDFVLAGVVAGLLPLVRRIEANVSHLRKTLGEPSLDSRPGASRGNQEAERALAEEIVRSVWAGDEDLEIDWTPPEAKTMDVNAPWWMEVGIGIRRVGIDLTPLQLSALSSSNHQQEKLKEQAKEILAKL